jgi:hypothetical protein
MRTISEEVEECPGFFMVPGYERIAINRKGMVYDLRLKFCYFPKYSDGNYPYVFVQGIGTLAVHRLLAYTFLMPDNANIEEYHELVINHKNGIKHDNDLDNIEWCTYQENSIHAYSTGLRDDNRPVLAKDLRTKDTVRFYSLNECARHFNVNQEKVHRYLRRKGSSEYPFKNFYELIYEGEEWRGLTADDIGKVVPGRPNPILVVADNRVIIFDSSESAGKHFNMSSYKIRRLLNEREKNGPLKVFNLNKCQVDVDNAEFISSTPKRSIPKRKPIPIKVTNLDTGEETDWESVAAFGHVVGVSKNTIQKGMSANNGIWRNYMVCYV